MEKICKNCKHWEERIPSELGGCLSTKLIENKWMITPIDGLGYSSLWIDGIGQHCTLETGAEFGCIHHQYKDMKLSFDTDCDGDTCISCGS